MRLLLATQNRHKINEIRAILKDWHGQLISLVELAPQYKIEEIGATLEENAKLKAEIAMRKFNEISLGEDTGLEVDILFGRPGVYSARYAGDNATYEQNVVKLLTELKDIPIEKRTARFRCLCALAFPEKYNIPTQLFEGVCMGRIIFEPRGKGGFGYDPIFVPNGYTTTFAELTSEEKNRISHRALALIKVRAYLDNLFISK
ncbi:MAG: RdgB/HAM1 family non-canonical purine NTP pyrophosphatase [candidate division WOR-3 bacterium]